MKLNQIIAIEKPIKAKMTANANLADKTFQKPDLFDGFIKKYQPNKTDDETVPTQVKRVQQSAPGILSEVVGQLATLFDITLLKEAGNRIAVADVRVDDQVVIPGAPVTYLLFLEKQLTDLATLVDHMPVLDAAEDWELDESQGVWKTKPTVTTRTKKVARPIVLHGPTVEHPAQTQLITEDVSVGTWEQVRISGAIPLTKRKALIDRIEQLRTAVKLAREQANLHDVEEVKSGAAIVKWLTA